MKREKLIKVLICIAILIILTTVAGTLLFRSRKTVQNDAPKHPKTVHEETKKEEKNQPSENDTPDQSVPEETAPPPAVPENNTTGTTTPNIPSGEDIAPNRVTYQENFYYEPLSSELRAFITGKSFPSQNASSKISYEELRYVHVMHYNFEGQIAEGELICNTAIAQDLVEIFYELYRAQYGIEKIHLIDEYNGNDDLSMKDNNTSCFNYRVIAGTNSLSNHAYGFAVDINPFYNPYVRYNTDGSLHVEPMESVAYADRTASFPHKIDENDLCCKLFKAHGFTWGGNWNPMKDYQHFEKN